MDYFYYLINIVVMLIFFLRYQKKEKKFNQSSLILISWLFATICGFLYVVTENTNVVRGTVSITPVLFVITLIVIALLPFTKLRQLNNYDYSYDSSAILSLITIFVALVGALPCIESIIHIFANQVYLKMGDYHDNRVAMGLTQISHLSFIGKHFHRIALYVNIVAGVLLFNYLNKQNKRKDYLIMFGLFLSFCEPTVTSFAYGSRWAAYQFLFLFSFMMLLFWNTMSVRIRKKILKISMFAGILVVVGFAIISISRFGSNNDESFVESIYRYAGEGFDNTYKDMWNVKHHTYGAHIFRNTAGIRPAALRAITGIRMHVYYTFVGDLICDFTIWGAAIIVILFSYLMYKVMRKPRMSIEDILLIILYAYTLLTAYTYIPFMNTAPCIVGTFIVYFLLKLDKINKNV